MRIFPNERERSAEVQHSRAAEFDFASRIYDYWMTRDLGRGLESSPLPPNVITLFLALRVQLGRQFRSVYDDCRRCEASIASIIARSLFETSLAFFFIIKPDVYVTPAISMKNGKPKRDQHGNPIYHAKVSPTQNRATDCQRRCELTYTLSAGKSHESATSRSALQGQNLRPAAADCNPS